MISIIFFKIRYFVIHKRETKKKEKTLDVIRKYFYDTN